MSKGCITQKMRKDNQGRLCVACATLTCTLQRKNFMEGAVLGLGFGEGKLH